MPKISISMPDEILKFIDNLGKNRSRTIVEILQEYRKNKQELELIKAYEEYREFCEEDDKDYWNNWEVSCLRDIDKENE
ncbi:MAG TPA: hypothetical protein PL110_03700 [Candidatus Eremiobacteraeota bacterium]|nr:MAG: hypothetical protein BWY64_03219 [bacterium ADurb.Bin363]HPZ07191.1 hypothetical protein [Candidatus Eremiobacteraeota bacterium]